MSRLFKTSICYLLSVIISVTSVLTIFIGGEVKAACYIEQGDLNRCCFEQISGTLQKSSQYFNRLAYVYSDKYFENSASEYNPALATMSLCLDISSFSRKDTKYNGINYKNQSKNVNLLLRELGFEDIRVNSDFRKKPNPKTIGAATGHKKIDVCGKSYTLIPIVIRGEYYGSEWANNMLIGAKGNHVGFSYAADSVKKFVDEYINKTNDIEGNIKFWIVGYSRGGAVAGLVGKLYNDYCDIYERASDFFNYNKNISINKDDIYTYTFESPKGLDISSDDFSGKYSNIHNIINDDDLVTKLAVKCYGFARPGVDHKLLKDKNQEDICRVKKILSIMCVNVYGDSGVEYKADRFKTYGFNWFSKDISTQSKFLDEFLKMFASCLFDGRNNNFKTFFRKDVKGLRMAYFKHEQTISRLAELLLSDEDFIRSIGSVLNKKYSKFDLFFKAVFSNSALKNSVMEICDDVFEEYNLKADPERKISERELKSLKAGICDMLICFNKISNYRYFYIFFKNIDNIVSSHEPEICLASLIDEDPNRDIYLNQMKNIIYSF